MEKKPKTPTGSESGRPSTTAEAVIHQADERTAEDEPKEEALEGKEKEFSPRTYFHRELF